jgi:hypothetical protein
MAEINIQRKSSNALWWVLGIVALVILVWFLFTWMGADTRQPMTGTGLPGGSVATVSTSSPLFT